MFDSGKLNFKILSALIVVGLSPSAGSAQDCPDYSAAATREIEASSQDLYSRQSFNITAGGSYSLEGCLKPDIGRGYVQYGPDLSLYYDDLGLGRALRIQVIGDCDTVLLVNTPDRDYLYVDDVINQNPSMRLEGAGTGRYDIWIGTYRSSVCSSTVELETF